MRISLARSGGFGGIRPPPVIVDTEKLPPAEGKKLEALVQSSGIRALNAAPQPKGPAQPDRFSYTLTLSEPSGREQQITLSEQDLTPDQVSLFEAVKKHG